MDEVIKAMAQAIEELGDQTLTNRVAGVIAVEKSVRLSRYPAARQYVAHSDGAAPAECSSHSLNSDEDRVRRDGR